MYGQSMPWPVKVAIFTAATLKAYSTNGEQRELTEKDFHICYGVLMVFLVASVLPSLVFSVRRRRETTLFVTQSALMLFAIGVYMVVLYRRNTEDRMYACVSLLVLSTHFLFMIFRATSRTPSLLLYSSAVGWGSLVFATGIIGMLVNRLPSFHMHGVVSLCLMFVGEILGLAVFLLDAVFRAVADAAETAFV